MQHSTTTLVSLLGAVLLVGACHHSSSGGSGGGGPSTTAPPVQLGDPIEGLSEEEVEAFERGRVLFSKRFKPSEGLGPFYNATSCASCHSTPVPGGSSQLYRNFYLAMWGPPPTQGIIQPFLSPVVPAYGTGLHSSATFTLEGGRVVIPDSVFSQPVVTAQRNSIPIFGVGLFEFVSNATILAGADPNDTDGDGISGRANGDAGSVGRFGVKAQSNNIELFTRAPLQNQMGITSDAFAGTSGIIGLGMAQASANPDEPTADNDGVPDPEISMEDLGDLIAFSRFLAPPAKKTFNDAATRGELHFDSLGCVKCHVPVLESSRGPVEAYTDLLLHNMGPELADGLSFGIPQASLLDPLATDQEFRTQPLWGVSMHQPFLHDGRAETLDEAITLHGGESEAIRDAYLALSESERADIIAFLEHL